MLSKEVNYQSERKLLPKYRLDQLTQQSNVTPFNIPVGGGTTSVFEIPSVAFNLARSYLTFTYMVGAQEEDFVNLFLNHLPMIQQIQFYGRNGQMMMDLSNFERYSKIIFNGCQTLDDLLQESSVLVRNNSGTLNGANIKRENNANANLNYTEQRYYASSGADDTEITKSYKIPLSIFKNTILALDKDLYFGDIVYLKIYWGPSVNAGFDCDNAAFANAGALEENGEITNLYLYLAVETEEVIRSSLASSIESPNGLSTLIDFIHTTNVPLSTTSQSFYVRYGPGMGLRLKRIYWTLNPTAGNNNLRYDFDNVNGAKVASFYTMLDSKRIIQYNIDCTDAGGNQDYMIMQPRLKGSCVQNANIYQHTWFWAESFDNMKLLENDDNLECGIPLDVERKYDVVATTANANHTYYIFGVVQKRLTITKLGVQIV